MTVASRPACTTTAFPDAVASWPVFGTSPPPTASSIVARAPRLDRTTDRLSWHLDVPRPPQDRRIAEPEEIALDVNLRLVEREQRF
ncbi:hypothetical protein ACFXGA_12820 [Actinosynnema sp. NPDC059335]|uniref:hypothetical protein n=1 Tax=Actinosynnema sp. NPDC059335 TaxID=3346804 RepID=UPI00366FEAD8